MILVIEKFVRKITNTFCYIGMGMLVILMFLGTADVLGRYFFNRPIKGAYEVSEILLAAIVFFGLAYAFAVGGHVRVDTFVALMRPRTRATAGIIISLLSFIIFVLIGWQGAELAMKSLKYHRLIDVIFVPIWPFQLLVPLGAFTVCLELIIQILHFIMDVRKES
jgi:TRAP-type C4-dicarboxylate transport system permease small subunit